MALLAPATRWYGWKTSAIRSHGVWRRPRGRKAISAIIRCASRIPAAMAISHLSIGRTAEEMGSYMESAKLAGGSAVADTIALTPRLPMRERVTLLSAHAVINGLSWLYLIRMPMAQADLGALGVRLLSVLPPRLTDVWLL